MDKDRPRRPKVYREEREEDMTMREQNSGSFETVPMGAMLERVTIETSRFGALEVSKDSRFTFATGIPGFGGCRELYLFPNPGGGCFEWLHASDETGLGFPVMTPDEALFDIISKQVMSARRMLGWGDSDEVDARLIVTIPAGNPEQATVNLRAPMLLNRTRGQGSQPLLNDETLPFRLPLFPQVNDD